MSGRAVEHLSELGNVSILVLFWYFNLEVDNIVAK